MRPLVAPCHLGLGTRYQRNGDRVKAEEHLTAGATLFREMDMSFWLEKARAKLELLLRTPLIRGCAPQTP